MRFAVNANATFVVMGDGTKYIQNYALTVYDDNFDYNGSFFANLGNWYLNDNIDPSEIGRTILLDFPDSGETGNNDYPIYVDTHGTTYRLNNFMADESRYNSTNNGTLLDVGSSVNNIVNNLYADGITKFIDPQGRAIVYGTNGSDSIDASPNLLNLPTNPFPKNSKMYEYYEENFHKGIALLGGDGSDTLIGSNFNDLLIGGHSKKQTDAFTDTLKGGEGTDTYISGNMDIISDEDGKGWVYFEGKLLTGGTKDAGAGCGTQSDGSQV